jgi:hypothetical protein
MNKKKNRRKKKMTKSNPNSQKKRRRLRIQPLMKKTMKLKRKSSMGTYFSWIRLKKHGMLKHPTFHTIFSTGCFILKEGFP